jgi:hypothetical protein
MIWLMSWITYTLGLPASSCILSLKDGRIWFSNLVWTRTWDYATLNCDIFSLWLKLQLQRRLLTPEGCSISTLITSSHTDLTVSCGERSSKECQSEDIVDSREQHFDEIR